MLIHININHKYECIPSLNWRSSCHQSSLCPVFFSLLFTFSLRLAHNDANIVNLRSAFMVFQSEGIGTKLCVLEMTIDQIDTIWCWPWLYTLCQHTKCAKFYKSCWIIADLFGKFTQGEDRYRSRSLLLDIGLLEGHGHDLNWKFSNNIFLLSKFTMLNH